MVKGGIEIGKQLDVSYQSVCFFAKALGEKIDQNQEELDEKGTRLLYSKLISSLEFYVKTMDKDFPVELDEDDYKFFADNPPVSNKHVEALESFYGPIWAQKARKLSAGIHLMNYN